MQSACNVNTKVEERVNYCNVIEIEILLCLNLNDYKQ